MLFQWAIEGAAAAYAGKVTFSIKFYRISEYDSFDYGELEKRIGQIRILPGMNVTRINENYIYEDNTILDIYQRIEEVSRSNDLHWLILEEHNDLQPVLSDNNYPVGTIDKSEEIYKNIT